LLLLGVDEAGYGPLLGPLAVAGAAFRVAEGASLAEALRPAVARPGERRRAGRLVVGDSKEVYGRTHDPALLELPVLAFLATADGASAPPQTIDELLRAAGIDIAARDEAPWYRAASDSLPRWADAGEVADAAGSLRRAFAGSGVSFAGFGARLLPEAALNDLLRRTGNKSDALFETSADVLERLVTLRSAGEAVRGTLDRQGGRRFYLPPLSRRWPSRFAWALDETPVQSRYAMRLEDGAVAELAFVVKADRDEPQVGLASLLAKYLRELTMDLWNEWFSARFPEGGRTAGYTVDARRWLDATRTAREAAGIPDERLVRIR
jgi:hypothetical protein